MQISPRVSVPTGCGGGKDYPSYSSFMGDIFIIVLLHYTIALSISTEEPDKPLVMASHRSTAADSRVGRAMGTYLAHSDLLHLPKLYAVTGKRGKSSESPNKPTSEAVLQLGSKPLLRISSSSFSELSEDEQQRAWHPSICSRSGGEIHPKCCNSAILLSFWDSFHGKIYSLKDITEVIVVRGAAKHEGAETEVFY